MQLSSSKMPTARNLISVLIFIQFVDFCLIYIHKNKFKIMRNKENELENEKPILPMVFPVSRDRC